MITPHTNVCEMMNDCMDKIRMPLGNWPFRIVFNCPFNIGMNRYDRDAEWLCNHLSTGSTKYSKC